MSELQLQSCNIYKAINQYLAAEYVNMLFFWKKPVKYEQGLF